MSYLPRIEFYPNRAEDFVKEWGEFLEELSKENLRKFVDLFLDTDGIVYFSSTLTKEGLETDTIILGLLEEESLKTEGVSLDYEVFINYSLYLGPHGSLAHANLPWLGETLDFEYEDSLFLTAFYDTFETHVVPSDTIMLKAKLSTEFSRRLREVIEEKIKS